MAKPLLERARSHIERRTNLAYEVATEHGQIFDNVAHMRWFVKAVAEEIAQRSSKPRKEMSWEPELHRND